MTWLLGLILAGQFFLTLDIGASVLAAIAIPALTSLREVAEMNLATARRISDACLNIARYVPPVRPREPTAYKPPPVVNPQTLPTSAELFGLAALDAWSAAGGDLSMLRSAK